VSEVVAKYDAVAEDYSSLDYADAERYYARRAKLVVEHGPNLSAGDSVLDFACGDGGLGRHLLARRIDYRGVDASVRMVEVARRTLEGRVSIAGWDYAPPEPVTATTIFRSLYLVPDRREFLAHLRGFTQRKLVFDFDPRAYAPEGVLADLAAAGWREVRLRPFLTPQRARLPLQAQRALWSLEAAPGARLVTRVRFPLLVSARPA
jgi:SAM-dependent methyltransferase